MAIKGQAIRPEMFKLGEYIAQPKEPDVSGLTKDEEILAQGADQSFWRILREHFDNEIIKLDMINDLAIEKGMPLDEIGRNTVVISQVKTIVRKIVNIVEDAKEANGK